MIINPYIFVPIGGYGQLYNYYAVSDANFLPADCAIPTESDVQTLSTTLGGDSVSGGKLKQTGLTHWDSPNTGADNSSNFSGKGTGWRLNDGTFEFIKTYGWWWTSTPSGLLYKTMELDYDSASIFYGTGELKYGLFVESEIISAAAKVFTSAPAVPNLNCV